MTEDLKIIKKKYGEDMMHLCRDLFPSLLEKRGLLSQILLNNFHESHYLCQDIVANNLEYDFKNFVYSFVDVENNFVMRSNKTPEELLREVGYILYECKSEEDMTKFKKYYAPGEELCSFWLNRLESSFVFFAVKENVDDIKREDFKNPKRQDLYGTSVISIQFTKDDAHTLSIKNRYNHSVNDPDATFSNNLDNIIPGLTDSFAKYYGLEQRIFNKKLDIPGYVKATDGKYYKYNFEFNNIYYCPDNIIVDNFEVKEYVHEKYVIMDYFVLDLVNKKISVYDDFLRDSLADTIKDIVKISIINEGENKRIIIITENGEIQIIINKYNQIIGLANNIVKVIGDNFLRHNKTLEQIDLANAEAIGDNFLYSNNSMLTIYLPKVKVIGNNFMNYTTVLKSADFPELESVGGGFLMMDTNLEELNAPKLNGGRGR